MAGTTNFPGSADAWAKASPAELADTDTEGRNHSSRHDDMEAAMEAVQGYLLAVTTNAQTGTTYTLVLSDAGKLVEMSNAAAIAMTVPPNASVAFPVGTRIDLLQTGAGQVTVTEGSGVTVDANTGLLLDGQWAAATLIKRATDSWVLIGQLSA